MRTVYSIYDELADMPAGFDAARLKKWKATTEEQKRLEELARKSSSQTPTKDEKDELNHYVVLERLIRLAKIRSDKHFRSVA
ncbi:MAG: hypothetical protein MUC38_02370 [Cyclobacteriaceae bacterium]|jgi:hypothetical protein|nr:hypothetical protein [Cyclobacteriaceae bacterium]